MESSDPTKGRAADQEAYDQQEPAMPVPRVSYWASASNDVLRSHAAKQELHGQQEAAMSLSCTTDRPSSQENGQIESKSPTDALSDVANDC